MALDWWTGVMGGLMAGSPQDELLMSFVNRCAQQWRVRAQRGRVAIIITDNLKAHTAQGSLLVRSMLAELSDQLSLVYTPAYDPDANRIEWRCARLTPYRHT
jgi:hypothetical protein